MPRIAATTGGCLNTGNKKTAFERRKKNPNTTNVRRRKVTLTYRHEEKTPLFPHLSLFTTIVTRLLKPQLTLSLSTGTIGDPSGGVWSVKSYLPAFAVAVRLSSLLSSFLFSLGLLLRRGIHIQRSPMPSVNIAEELTPRRASEYFSLQCPNTVTSILSELLPQKNTIELTDPRLLASLGQAPPDVE